MKRIALGVLLGLALSAPPLWALRIARPPEFYEWNTNTFSQFNDVLLQFWNLTNGLYDMDTVTADPDGTRRGEKGNFVLYDPGASEELCINVDDAKDWDCVALTP